MSKFWLGFALYEVAFWLGYSWARLTENTRVKR